jgi:hypothetical protein
MAAHLAITLLLQAASLPGMTVVPGDGNELVLKIDPFEERRLVEMKDAAADAISSACAGRPIAWGNLFFRGSVTPNSTESTRVVDYRQTFRCLDLDLAKYPQAPAGWKPAGADEVAASNVFKAYFDAIDSGALVQAFAMLEPNSGGSREEWISGQQIGRRLLSGKGERTLTGMRWFLNPPEAPYPGVFVRLTFAGKFAGVPVYCGSMVLYRAAPDAYLVGGAKEHILPSEDNPDSKRIAEYQKQFCE